MFGILLSASGFLGTQAGSEAAGPSQTPASTEEPEAVWLLEQWHALDSISQTVVALAVSLAIFLFFRVIIVRRLARWAKATENDLDDRLVHFLRRFYGIAMLFLTVLWVMHVWEVKISPLLAGAGILGISLGFAAKEFIADVLAGIFLVTDRPMRIGDRVNVEAIGRDWGSWGDVVDIGLRRTQIRNTDGVVVNYPNAVLSNSVITNYTHEPKPVRVRVRFAVGERADLAEARELTRSVTEAIPEVLDGTVEVLVRSIWDQTRGHLLSGVLLEARYRIADIRERTRVRSKVLEAILTRLRAENIPLASPTVVVDRPDSGA